MGRTLFWSLQMILALGLPTIPSAFAEGPADGNTNAKTFVPTLIPTPQPPVVTVPQIGSAALREYAPHPDIYSNRAFDPTYPCDVQMWYTTYRPGVPFQWLSAEDAKQFVKMVKGSPENWSSDARSWTLRYIGGFSGSQRWAEFTATYIVVAYNRNHCGGELFFGENFRHVSQYVFKGATFVLGYQANDSGLLPTHITRGLEVIHPVPVPVPGN